MIEAVSVESDHVFLKAVHQLLLSFTAIHKLVRDQIQARPLTAKIFSVGFDFLSLKVSQAGLKVFSTGFDVLKMSQAGLVSCHRAKLLVIWLSSCPSNTFDENQVFWKIVNICIWWWWSTFSDIIIHEIPILNSLCYHSVMQVNYMMTNHIYQCDLLLFQQLVSENIVQMRRSQGSRSWG